MEILYPYFDVLTHLHGTGKGVDYNQRFAICSANGVTGEASANALG